VTTWVVEDGLADGARSKAAATTAVVVPEEAEDADDAEAAAVDDARPPPEEIAHGLAAVPRNAGGEAHAPVPWHSMTLVPVYDEVRVEDVETIDDRVHAHAPRVHKALYIVFVLVGLLIFVPLALLMPVWGPFAMMRMTGTTEILQARLRDGTAAETKAPGTAAEALGTAAETAALGTAAATLGTAAEALGSHLRRRS